MSPQISSTPRGVSGVVLALCLFALAAVAVTGVAAAGQSSTASGGAALDTAGGSAVLADAHIQSCAATPPADHADPQGGTDDVTGWVDGYWYSESLDIDNSDGLDQDELERLTARTAARVEALRCHRFDGIPPLKTFSHDQYRNRLDEQVNRSYNASSRQFENAGLAAMLLVGQNQDAVNVTVENQAAFPAAFYDPQAEFMAFVTDTPEQVEIDEPTLAHELVHALQDDQFGIAPVFNATTGDERLSSLAVVEGDANLVQEQYRENCGASAVPGVPGGSPRQWADECLLLTPEQSSPPNWGLTLNQLAAYHAPLVRDTYEEEGWDGVDALFESLPDSMVEALDPEKYGEFERAEITVEDRSTDNWERVTPASTRGNRSVPGYEIVGQHGLTAMLIAPSFEPPRGTDVISSFEFQPAQGVFNYDHSATDGWQGDKLYGYASDAGETAAVWALRWNDAENASQFASAYEDLVEFRDGDPTEEGAHTYTFENSEKFDMALAVEQTGNRVQIVTAPTVEALDAVHRAVDTNKTDGGDNGGDGEGDSGESTGTDNSSADGDGAGFGIVVAVSALLGLVVAGWRGRQTQ